MASTEDSLIVIFVQGLAVPYFHIGMYQLVMKRCKQFSSFSDLSKGNYTIKKLKQNGRQTENGQWKIT